MTEGLAFVIFIMLLFPGLAANIAAEFTVKYHKALKKEKEENG